jgi:type II secretory pathway component PulJ
MFNRANLTPQQCEYETTRLQDHRTRRGRWSVVSRRWSSRQSAFTLPKQRERFSAFTLAELVVSMGVLVLMVLLFTQLLNSAATTTTLGNKRMDADSQARQLLDRMAIDFDQLLKRRDVSYYVKAAGNTQAGNDQIAFFSAVPGYYPSGARSPLSVVAYRVNNNATSSSYNKLERLGKGLVWNGVSATDTPMVFLPVTISTTWPNATNQNSDPAYEVMGSDVFRFEYYYLLKSANGYTLIDPITHKSTTVLSSGVGTYTASVNGTETLVSLWSSGTNSFVVNDVVAIVVAIAVIEPKSKVLLGNTDLATVAGTLTDFGGSNSCATVNWQNPGELLRQWQCTLDSTIGFPRPAISNIRLYERYYYLNQ